MPATALLHVDDRELERILVVPFFRSLIDRRAVVQAAVWQAVRRLA